VYGCGDRYEGAWVAGKREGDGTLVAVGGKKYVGMWAGDMRNGKGTVFDSDGTVLFDGEWKNGFYLFISVFLSFLQSPILPHPRPLLSYFSC
jgi:hypothetical protein